MNATASEISYRRPPIQEAVIDFRFSAPITNEKLLKFLKKVEKRYPFKQDQINFGFFISPGQVALNQSPAGYKLQSLEDLRIAILQAEGFTSSKLAPYLGWADLRKQTEDLLLDLSKVAGKMFAQRLGVRFINRLDIPGEDIDIAEWITLNVSLPTGLSTAINSFGVQVSFPADGDFITTVIIQSVQSPMVGNSSISLDIDVSCTKISDFESIGVWQRLEQMRVLKNRVFESCLTLKMRERFS